MQEQIAELRQRARQQPDYEAGPDLRRLLAVAGGVQDRLALAEAALDLAEPTYVEAALPPGDVGRQLQLRAQRMFSLAQLPQPVPPLGWQPVPGRVAYVLYSSLPWISTGYAVRSQQLARALQEAGADLHCLTRPGFPWDEDPAVLSADMPLERRFDDRIDGVPYLRSPEPQFGNWFNHAAYVRASADTLTEQLLELRPAVVMAASNHACALPTQIAARRLGLPMVYDMRGFWELSRAARDPAFLGSAQYRHERWLETRVAAQADHVFTLSQPMRQALIGRGVAAADVTFLPNGCVSEHFAVSGRGAKLAADLALDLPQGVPVIGYAGSFPAYEGLADLVSAAAALRAQGHHFRLLLVGDEHGTGLRGMPVTQALRQQAADLGLGDWLILPGRVPFDQVPAWLELIDICVFARRPLLVTEMVAPLKPVEAMAAGKAIVLSSVGGMQGLLEDGNSGLVFAKGDTTALQAQLCRLLEDSNLRHRLGQAAQARARAAYTWPQVARQMLARLTALGEGGSGPVDRP